MMVLLAGDQDASILVAGAVPFQFMNWTARGIAGDARRKVL
jgi:hypothetical protein